MLARDDKHWNRKGSERVAMLIYGLVTERDLLPAAKLSAWPEATRVVEEIHGTGSRTAARRGAIAQRIRSMGLRSALSFGPTSPATAAHVYAGIDSDGYVAPFGALVLARGDGQRLAIEGEYLGLPELRGGRATVFVEELRVGEIALDGKGTLTATFDLPAALDQREYATVRFESDDFVYGDPVASELRSFRLREIAIR